MKAKIKMNIRDDDLKQVLDENSLKLILFFW